VRPPVATYRLQLTPGAGFARARNLVPYISSLGISHLYLSPILEARPGSAHGYDQTDPTLVRAELGGEAGLRHLAEEAARFGLRLIVDIVPNHVAAHHDCPLWWEVLRVGRSSPRAALFDIDWPAGGGRVVLPVLSGPVDEACAAGEIVVLDDPRRGTVLRHFDRLFPLGAGTEYLASAGGPPTPELLARQHYDLAWWREGLTRVNYRRFFDVADLVAVRIENPDAFEWMHGRILELVRDGLIGGVRVDHVDGLYDPRAYLLKLRDALDRAAGTGDRPLILVEKILAAGEAVPEDWPVDGTTGYEFLAAATQGICRSDGVRGIRAHARRIGGCETDFGAVVVNAKRQVTRELLAADLAHLVRLFRAAWPTERDPPPPEETLSTALVELSVRIGVYRTYADADGIAERDRRRIEAARDQAAAAAPELKPVFDGLTRLLLRDESAGADPAAAFRLLTRWQQFTGPLAAKGIEDTALYRDTAFVALNDVGCEPTPAGNPEQMLRNVLDSRTRFRCSLNATATHDTKRGEDARCRLAALSWIADDWTAALDRFRRGDTDLSGPEWLLTHQTIVALWPDFRRDPKEATARIESYLVKAAREAKDRTGWLNPDAEHEAKLTAFTRRLLLDPAEDEYRENIDTLDRVLAPRAVALSVALLLLKALSPGVPDIYQGCEGPDYSLVDPDNRRPVDFAHRATLLNEIRDRWSRDRSGVLPELFDGPASPRLKVFVLWRALACRRWLLAAGGSLVIDRLYLRHDAANPFIAWSVRCGDREADVVAGLSGAARPADSLRWVASVAEPFDQITAAPLAPSGESAGRSRSCANLVLRGVHEVV